MDQCCILCTFSCFMFRVYVLRFMFHVSFFLVSRIVFLVPRCTLHVSRFMFRVSCFTFILLLLTLHVPYCTFHVHHGSRVSKASCYKEQVSKFIALHSQEFVASSRQAASPSCTPLPRPLHWCPKDQARGTVLASKSRHRACPGNLRCHSSGIGKMVTP